MILIAQYQGRSFVSWMIKKQTRSIWSHTAAVLQDRSVVESWHVGGVSHVPCLSTNHSPGTKVDLFRIEATKEQTNNFEEYLLSLVGLKYDFKSVFRFLSKTPALLNDKFFCSEAIAESLASTNLFLQKRIRPAEMSPQITGISPLMIYQESIITGEPNGSELLYC